METRPIIPDQPAQPIQTHENSTCSICMDNLLPSEAQVTLGCSHHFHYTCIMTWNLQSRDQNHRSCPVCRDNMNIDDALPEPTPRINTLTSDPIGHLGERQLDHVVNAQQGVCLTCTDCHGHFNFCDMCGIYVCDCEYTYNDNRWSPRTVHARANPFGETPEDLEPDELPPVYCSNCFENRDGFVLDFMMDDHGDIDVFYHDRIQELYEALFNDTSGKDNTELYQMFP